MAEPNLNPHHWSENAFGIIQDMPEYERFAHDKHALDLIDWALFDRDLSTSERSIAKDWLAEYFEDHYDYEFFDVFDWDAWREEMGY